MRTLSKNEVQSVSGGLGLLGINLNLGAAAKVGGLLCLDLGAGLDLGGNNNNNNCRQPRSRGRNC